MLRLSAPPGCRFIRRPAPASGAWALQPGTEGAEAIPLAAIPFVMGRAGDCQLILPDSPELRLTTSRWHCHIRVRGADLLLEDGSLGAAPELGRRKPSNSGTLRNGRRISEPEPLRPGDRIRLGPWEFSVAAEGGEAEKTVQAEAEGPSAEPGGARFGELECWMKGQLVAGIYEVRGLLGVGGMGAVYRVRHKAWDVDLAVKRPAPHLLAAAGGAERFVREAETWVNLPLHPHIVTAYYVRTVGGSPAIFAECVEGGDLQGWIQQGRFKDLPAALDAAIQVCWGMAAAHGKGLVHRDLKPANVLMGRGGEAKVTDFGLVKRAQDEDEVPQGEPGSAAADGPEALTRLGAQVGTPVYMPPEQWMGMPAGPAADVYAFGIVLYELLCGRVPFELGPEFEGAGGQARKKEYSRMHIWEPAPDPKAWEPRLPEALAALMRRCLAKDPAQRPQAFSELAGTLIAFYREVSGADYSRRDPGGLESRAVDLNNRALSMLDLGKVEEARQLFREALKADPHHAEAKYNHAILKWQGGELDDIQVVKRMEEVLRAQPDRGAGAYLLGLVHLRRADALAAEGVLAGLSRRPGVGAEALLALGDARMALGAHGKAEAAYARALELGPGSREAERRMVAALAAQDKRKEAAALWGGEELGEALRGQAFPNMACAGAFPGHRGYIQCLAATPDGRHALSAALDKTIRLWELETGRCLSVLGGLENTPFLVVSPDGRFVLSAGVGGAISFWELATGRCVQRVEGHARNISALAMTPDGRHAVSGDDSGTMVFWDLSAASPPGVTGLKELQGRGKVCALAITAEGRWVLEGGDDGMVRLWDTVSGKVAMELAGHLKAVTSLALVPGGRLAVSSSFDDTVRLWDLAAGRCVRTLEGHSMATSAAVSPDGRRILSGGMDKTVRLWDLDSGACLRTFSDHAGSVYSVAFTPDGRALSGGSDKVLRLWSLASRLTPLPPAFAHFVSSEEAVALRSEAAALRAAVERDAERGAWGPADEGLRQARRLPGYEKDAGLLALADRIALKGVKKSLASFWVHGTLRGHAGPVSCVALSPDERWVLSAGMDKTLRLWELGSGRSLVSLEGGDGRIAAAVFLPGGALALTAGEDRVLNLHDLSAGKVLRRFEGHTDRVNAVAAAPDGRSAVSAGEDGTLRLWDLAEGRGRGVLEGHRGGVKAVAVSPDGRCAASAGDDSTVRLWELASGRCLRTLTGHEYGVHCLAFTADGRLLLSGSGDHSLRIWDLAAGTCARVVEDRAGVSFAHVSPEGRHVLSGVRGATSFRIWGLEGGGAGAELDGHSKPVACVALSASGRYAVSGGLDAAVQVWRLDWEHEFPARGTGAELLRPFLEIFLEVRGGRWGEADWTELLARLGSSGLGGVAAEDARGQLEALTRRFPAERGEWLRRRWGLEL